MSPMLRDSTCSGKWHSSVCSNLQWQKSSSRVDQVNTRQAVLNCYFLCPQLLLHCDWIRCATFHCGIVGNKHTPQAIDPADAWMDTFTHRDST